MATCKWCGVGAAIRKGFCAECDPGDDHPIHDRLMEFDMSRNRFLPKGFVADLLRNPRPPEEAMREYKAAILKNMRPVSKRKPK
jgi:hypothetical protein